jgi:hypothetical protein
MLVHSEFQAQLPANSSLSGGTAIFSATLKTAGTRTISATDTLNSSARWRSRARPSA